MVHMVDVAKKCGVSQTLVSLVLNGRDKEVGISAATRALILKTASEMGYCRNEMASSIARQKSKVLAFVSANMGSVEYSGRIQNGIFAEANAGGYAVNVFHWNPSNARSIAEKIVGWMTSGVIFHVADRKQVAKLCIILKKNNIPYGFANLSNPDGIGVTTDDYSGAKEAVSLLIRQGRKRIQFLSNAAAGGEYLQKRETGYIDAMKEFLPEVKPESVYLGNSLESSVVKKICEIIRKKKADAFFCVGDDVAMRAEAAILSLGLHIPEDIAVIGYGNLQMGAYAPIPLSTVDQDYEEMGKLVVQAILHKTKSGENNVCLPVKLLIRESTE